jgi:putative hydrolase of the HAD superfamily
MLSPASLPRCLVFDVDDTLYYERDYVRSGFAAVGVYAEREHGIAGLGPACWALFESGVRGSTFDRALTGLGRTPDPALVTELVGVYRAHPPHITLLPDAQACLERWLGRAYIGIVTDGPAVSQRAKIAALKLSAYVDHAVVTSELAADAGKPDPRAFALLQGEVGCSDAQCCYVADNPAKDFGGPCSLGWRTVRLRRAGGLHAATPSGADVDREIVSLDELDGAL